MAWCGACIIVLCAGFTLGSQYSVPQPTIEAYTPRGLKLSIPDVEGITKVQFYLSFNQPLVEKDPGTVAKAIDAHQGTQWIYYNPSVILQPGQSVNYKITVTHNGAVTDRRGSYTVDRVIAPPDSPVIVDCEDEGQQVAAFPNLPQFSSTGKKSELKSFSSYKSFDARPVTRSSTTTTSGTFYVKPSGTVEASGFKASSNYDSTRREGEQWQHSKSHLTTAEIEELKALHGQDFFTLPEFAHLQGASGGSSSSYYQRSGYSSSSQSRPSSSYDATLTTSQVRPSYESSLSSMSMSSHARPLGYDSSLNSGSSSYTPPPPLLRPEGERVRYSANERHESTSSAHPSQVDSSYSSSRLTPSYSSAPLALHRPTDDHDDGQVAQSVHFEGPEVGQVASNPESSYSSAVQTNYRKETVQSSSAPVVTYPSRGSVRENQVYESISPPKTVITLPVRVGSVPTVTYNGEIFRSSVRPSSPQSCTVANYGRRADLVELEKNVKEMECLAVLAENTMKAEIYALKEANTDLKERLAHLETQFQKFQTGCKCY